LLLGLKVAGSDLDRQAVHGAGENLQWLVKEYGEKHGLTENYRLSVQDVTQVTMQESGTQADVIVTEPFLGKPNPLPAQVDNMLKGLEKLYLGAFKQWKQVLKVGGVVAITLPVVSTGKSVKTVQNLIDRLESLGYTRENGSFLYTKLHATVQRAVSFYRLNTK
jgi:tRNA G10  N-methylase Trm11